MDLLKISLLSILLVLIGCEAVPVKDVESVRTKVALDPSIAMPLDIPVAYYVPHDDIRSILTIDNGYYGRWKFYTGAQFKKALELVMPKLFTSAEQLSDKSEFSYLFKFKSNPSYSNSFGAHKVGMKLEVVDNLGAVIYTGETSSTHSSSAGGDHDAFLNAYATAIKELTYRFANSQGSLKLAEKADNTKEFNKINLRKIAPEIKKTSSGTGFFLNNTGAVLTAAHVIENCVMVEVYDQGQAKPVTIEADSKLLDLAVLETNFKPESIVSLTKKTNNQDLLGRPIFTTGFPLSSVLSEYPSMTMGNVSSLGGLRGSQGHFQFSAPIQPGNSGGAVLDYQGNVIGLVGSTLNQVMMLKSSGTTAQNVNFAVSTDLITKFLNKHNVTYSTSRKRLSFEDASKVAVKETVQVLCYN